MYRTTSHRSPDLLTYSSWETYYLVKYVRGARWCYGILHSLLLAFYMEKGDVEKRESAPSIAVRDQTGSDIDLATYHEVNAGRLVVDPEEAKVELGEAIAAKLKLSRDGTKVLWPQPTDSPNDPQNWSDRKKSIQLLIITLAAIVPDFDSGIGIAGIFKLAEEYHTTPGVINDMTSNWSIFLLGWGGLFAVMLIRRLGRLPILFWSQILALAFLVGCTFAPNLATFTAMRCLTALFGTAPQVTGLYVVTDLYPFHLQARNLNIWTAGFIISPFLSPFAFGFLVARASWRWAYGIGCMYGAVVCALIILFMEETMYDRRVKPIPEAPKGGLKNRFNDLVGITGMRMSKYRPPWRDCIWSPLNVVWRPHLLGILIFEAAFFGLGIGINFSRNYLYFSPSSRLAGYQCRIPWRRIWIFTICNCWRVRNTDRSCFHRRACRTLRE